MKYFWSLALLLTAFIFIKSEGQEISGRISDKLTNETLIGVNILLDGKGIASSDYDGNLFEIQYWKDGKKHGKFEQFFQNGQLKQTSNYYMGVKQGVEINYYFSGALHSKGLYKDGFKSSVWEYYSKDGVLDTTINIE